MNRCIRVTSAALSPSRLLDFFAQVCSYLRPCAYKAISVEDVSVVMFILKCHRHMPGRCGSVAEHRRPLHPEVAGSIPGQGTCPGFRPDPQWGACRRRPIDVLSHRCFSLLSFSLPLSPKSKKRRNKNK
uniref:Uncharacterized protein n=1 Tax=Molossus molossus TaxID=27622 RepID=A0A7J8BLY4_MOLMO|nr:hypothetical protein HJG59_010132 [Molossus molossus]